MLIPWIMKMPNKIGKIQNDVCSLVLASGWEENNPDYEDCEDCVVI